MGDIVSVLISPQGIMSDTFTVRVFDEKTSSRHHVIIDKDCSFAVRQLISQVKRNSKKVL